MSYTVFISSTKKDLEEYRAAVKACLLRDGLVPIEMDDFMAQSDTGLNVSKKELAKADLFVGIYAWRYGHVPTGSERSITEEEFHEARRLGKDCLCFEVEETHPWPPGLREEGLAAERLRAFKEHVRSQLTVKRFTTPDTLEDAVQASIIRWLFERLGARLRPLREAVEKRCGEALAERTSPSLLDLELEWRDRLGGPLGLQAPRSIGEEELSSLLQDRKRLLIVGVPGSGKTIALLRLTRDLVAGAVAGPDSREPYPVVLSLASWNEKDQNFSDFLLRQLHDDFPGLVDPDDLRAAFERGYFLPLLDDLDRLDPEQRLRCIEAIREFLEGRGAIAVSVRTSCYDRQERPDLKAEAFLEPIDPDQVDTYLAASGPGLENLQQALREREGLRRLSGSPMMLLLMIRLFRNEPEEALAELGAATEERLAELYVQKMLEGEKKLSTMRQPLAWLARKIKEQRTARFEIEKLQPAWLSSALERAAYTLITRTLGGVLLMLPPSLVPGYWFWLLCGAASGALAGLIDALPLWEAPASRKARDSVGQAIFRALLITAGSFVLFLWISSQWAASTLPLSLLFAALFGLLFGSRPAGLREDIRFFEKLRRGWSGKGALAGAAVAASLLLALPLLGWLLEDGQLRSIQGLTWAILALGAAVFFGAPLGGLVGGLEGSFLELRKEPPGLGLRRIARNAVRVARRTALPLAAVLWAVLAALKIWTDTFLSWPGFALAGVVGVPLVAIVGGLYAGFWFSGMDALQHLILRFLLSATGRFPWRWGRFLDRAADRGLLLCIDGGYEFPFEPVIREYFEKLPPEEDDPEG